MTPDLLLLAVFGVPVLAGAAAAAGLAWAVYRDPGQPVTPEWTVVELATVTAEVVAGGDVRRPCTLCPARHCAGCEEPARVTATWTRYVARHCWEEIPPSLRRLAELLPVTLRCTVVAQAVGPRWTPRPGWSRTALELWARQVARRYGIAPLLGRLAPVGALP